MRILLTQPGKLNTVPMGRFARDALIQLGHEVIEFDTTPNWHEKLHAGLLGTGDRYAAMNRRFRRAVESESPDLMLAIFGFDISSETLEFVKQRGIPRARWWLNDPFQFQRSLTQARHYDFLFTNSMGSVADYHQEKIRHAHWLPVACAPEVHRRTAPRPEYRCEICFAGDWSPLREAWCEKLATHFDLRILGPWKRKLSAASRLQSCLIDGFFTPEQMVDMFSSASVVFNLHSWYGQWDHGTNPRLFEAAGCGACQVVDSKRDIPQLFDTEGEVCTFNCMEDMLEKVGVFLADDIRRNSMGENAQRRALAEHTYLERMKKLMEIVGHGA